MQRLERGRKSCRLMAESGLSACGVCVRFGLRTRRLRVARKRRTAGLCVRCAIRQGRGRGSVGEGRVGWRRTLLEDRSPPAQCSPATSSLLRVAQVGGGLKHTVEAASGVRARRRGSLGASQPHRRGVHPGATPSSLFMVEVSQEAPQNNLGLWVSLSVFGCL